MVILSLPRSLVRLEYEEAARAYLQSLPPEHFMEGTEQATQREITVASLAVVKTRRDDLHYFSELLLQYPFGRARRIRQVVPDNMVVKHKGTIQAKGSYDLPLQPAGPFWVMEYVSEGSKRKDYKDSFEKYERELKVPYYLLFYPEKQELTLFRYRGRKYRATPPNAAGRYPVPELDLEVGLLDGWVRYWHQGELVPLPAELVEKLKESEERRRQAEEAARQAREEARQAREEARRAREETRQAREEARQAQGEAGRERRDKERLLAQLRALGIEPEV